MNRIEKITIILANLVTVIQKRGDYNLDEYSNKIAALYSSQESQSVSTPTEGLELTNEEAAKADNEVVLQKGFHDLSPIEQYWAENRAICKAQVAKVLKNLPTEQEIREKYEAKIKELEAYKKEEPAFEAMIKREAKSKILSVIDAKCAHVGLVGSGREKRIISADLWSELSGQSPKEV